ncbi:MAG: 4Fe-4S binding protein [Thermodesulfobacteriota bacterium]
MKWDQAAEKAVARVPFFVRKRVKARVEEEARRSGALEVRLIHVQKCQKAYLADMEQEVKGYQVETCFGASGCPNRAVADDELAAALEAGLIRADLKSFLKERVNGPLKMHHEFRVSMADCPNACSRPQIADLGLIGASRPVLADPDQCHQCGACVSACREQAVTLPEKGAGPIIDRNKCLACGQCHKACPTGALQEEARGYRVQVGGRLGRHPRLAQELPGLYSTRQVLEILDRCLDIYKEHNREGERFGEVLSRTGYDGLAPRKK